MFMIVFKYGIILVIAFSLLACPVKQKVKDGILREYHNNGRIYSEINYKDGKKHGLFRTWFDNGQLHDSAYFENDSLIGYGVSYYHNGVKNYEEQRNKSHKKFGYFKFWYDNGVLGSIEYFINGQLHGEWKKYYKTGQPEFILNYVHGEKDGKCIYFKENGDTLRVEIYDKGRLIKPN